MGGAETWQTGTRLGRAGLGVDGFIAVTAYWGLGIPTHYSLKIKPNRHTPIVLRNNDTRTPQDDNIAPNLTPVPASKTLFHSQRQDVP